MDSFTAKPLGVVCSRVHYSLALGTACLEDLPNHAPSSWVQSGP